MCTKRLAIATLGGGIVMYAVGYLIWDIAFAEFFASSGSAKVARETAFIWPQILGTFSLAALVALGVGKGKQSSIGEGFKIGATVGFLVWFGVDFIRYGMSDVLDLTATIVDPLLEIVRSGIGGAVIAALLGKVEG